jgi:uncharacterized DUF497 family protein
MYFEWDADKNRINQRKHRGIDFALALRIFNDPNVLIEEDRVEEGGEVRLHALGRINQLVLLVVHVHKETNHGEETIRIISAREASKSEVRRYFAQAAH